MTSCMWISYSHKINACGWITLPNSFPSFNSSQVLPVFYPTRFIFSILKTNERQQKWSLFCVGHLLLGMGPAALECGWYNSVALLKRIDFLSARIYRTFCSLPSLHAQILSGYPSLWIHTCNCPIVSGKCSFLKIIHHLWLFESFCLFSYIDP